MVTFGGRCEDGFGNESGVMGRECDRRRQAQASAFVVGDGWCRWVMGERLARMCGWIQEGLVRSVVKAIAYYPTVVGAGTKWVCFCASVRQCWGAYVSGVVLDCAVSGQDFRLEV